MDRELEFRAWDRKHKVFRYIRLVRGLIVLPQMELADLEEWQQYTGLLDRNNIKIYGGDVLKQYYDNGFNTSNLKRFRVVEWRVGRIQVGWNIANSNTQNREVVGNIYENAGLLI